MAVRYSPYPAMGKGPMGPPMAAKGMPAKGWMGDPGKGWMGDPAKGWKGDPGKGWKGDPGKGWMGDPGKGDPWGMPAKGKGPYQGSGGTIRLDEKGGVKGGWQPEWEGKGGQKGGWQPEWEGKGQMIGGPPADMGGKGGWAFKTKLCKFFEQGTCKNGPGCEFAHGMQELGGAAPAKGFDKGFGKGFDKGFGKDKGFDKGWGKGPAMMAYPGGGQENPGAFTRLCKFWELGSCPQGRNCTFAHSVHELQSGKGKAQGKGGGKRNVKTMMCANWEATGTCPRASEECMFAHGPEELQEYVASEREVQFAKTKMCKFYQEGRCSRGDECLYAHGEVELMPVEFEAPPGPTVYDHAALADE